MTTTHHRSLSLIPQKHGERPFTMGSISDVFLGSLNNGKTLVALKDLRGMQPYDKAMDVLRENLKREIGTWVQLDHKNIATFYGYSTKFGPILTFVSAFYKNGSVMSYMKQRPGQPIAFKYLLMAGIAEGLEYLHTREPPIVHGDLRGSNVLVDDGGAPRLTDFSLMPLTSVNDFTTANIAGPCRWQAPELFEFDEDADNDMNAMPWSTQADIYSLGMTFLEIITEGIPFKEIRHDTAVILAVLRGTRPRKPLGCDKEFANRPTDLALLERLWEALLMKCWDQTRAERPTIYKVREILTKAQTG